MELPDINALNRVLLCTNHMFGWGGSELVLLELAEEFSRRNMGVHVFANEVSGELRTALINCGAQVVENAEDVDLFSFDLVYAQHHVVPLILEKALNIPFDTTRPFPVFVYNHLSPYEPMETPGPFIEREIADIILANSSETAKKMTTFGRTFERIEVFPNPAPWEFGVVDDPPGEQLRRLLVVSNHLPPELETALDLVERTGVAVKRIGVQHTAHRVVPEALQAHDAVVSIGKTFQYALRAKRPVFCYDRYAGPGWLSDAESFAAAKEVNFSGRDATSPRTPQVLADEIIAGYPAAREFVINFPTEEEEEFLLELQVDKLLKRTRKCLNEPGRNASRWDEWQSQRMRQLISHEAAIVAIIRNEFHWRRSSQRVRGKKGARAKIRRLFQWVRHKGR